MLRNKKYNLKKNVFLVLTCIVGGLIILSSCSVRKTIQSYLAVPVTQSLNKGQAAFSGNNTCQLTEKVVLTGKVVHPPKFSHGNSSAPTVFAAVNNVQQSNYRAYQSDSVATGIPLFILHKQLKIFG